MPHSLTVTLVFLLAVVPAGGISAGAMAGLGTKHQHARPRALAVDARGDLVYVALSTADRLAVVDVAAGGARMVAQVPVCAFPEALAALPQGGVVVACRFAPGLRVVTRDDGGPGGVREAPRFQIRVVDAGPEHGHQGIAVDAAGRFAYVASPPRGGVKIVSLDGGGTPPRFVATGLSPHSVQLIPGGPAEPGAAGGHAPRSSPLLLVSNFIGHTVTVHRVERDGGLSAAVQTIHTEAPVLAFAVMPRAPSAPPTTEPALGRGDDLGGALLLATHEDRSLSRANISVEGLDSVLLVLRRSAAGQTLPFVDPGTGKRQTINLSERKRDPLVQIDALAVAADAPAAAVAAAAVGAGTDNLLTAKPGLSALLDSPAWPVGAHPVAVAFLGDGRIVTADHLSDTLTFVSPTEGGTARGPGRAGSSPAIQTVRVGNPERATPADRGELLFYSRALVPNNVADGPLSVYTCAACHADGQIDGRRHPSKRNRFFSMTKTCRGLGGTEPFLSLGKPDTFAAFADNIVSTHAQGALDAPDTFDRYPVSLRLRVGTRWTTLTLSPGAVRAALAAYMARIPVEPSPFVAPGRSALTEAERRGLATFRENCAGCHQLSRSTTGGRAIPPRELERELLAGKVALTSARLYDVGTPVLGAGGNNPPSLRGVWAAAPYFSDGSAPTLEAVLDRTNPNASKVHAPENARLPRPFDEAARRDLLAFLRAL